MDTGRRYFGYQLIEDLNLLKSLSVDLPPRPKAPPLPEEPTEDDRHLDLQFQLALEAWRSEVRLLADSVRSQVEDGVDRHLRRSIVEREDQGTGQSAVLTQAANTDRGVVIRQPSERSRSEGESVADLRLPRDRAPKPGEALEVYTRLAAEHGLIRPGDKLDQNMVDMMAALVGLCANIGDGYGDAEAGGNAGEHIRAVYWVW